PDQVLDGAQRAAGGVFVLAVTAITHRAAVGRGLRGLSSAMNRLDQALMRRGHIPTRVVGASPSGLSHRFRPTARLANWLRQTHGGSLVNASVAVARGVDARGRPVLIVGLNGERELTDA